MKACLICESSVRFIKFKCRDGYVCKTCYETVSLNFSQTIKSKNKEELLLIYQVNALNKETVVTDEQPFEITRRIGQFLLFDDRHQLLCLPNHSKYTKEQRKPEIFPFDTVLDCHLEEKKSVLSGKKVKEVGTIKLTLIFSGEEQSSRVIWLIANPVRRDSVAYQTMQKLAKKVRQEIKQLQMEETVC